MGKEECKSIKQKREGTVYEQMKMEGKSKESAGPDQFRAREVLSTGKRKRQLRQGQKEHNSSCRVALATACSNEDSKDHNTETERRGQFMHLALDAAWSHHDKVIPSQPGCWTKRGKTKHDECHKSTENPMDAWKWLCAR